MNNIPEDDKKRAADQTDRTENNGEPSESEGSIISQRVAKLTERERGLDEVISEEEAARQAAAGMNVGADGKPVGGESTIRTPFTMWFENFWYHYKWPTIISLFVLVTVIISAVQCSSTAKIDSLVLYAGNYDMGATQISGVKNALQSVVDDYNEDGEHNVELVNLFIMSPDEVKEFNEKNRDDGLTVNTALLSNNWEVFQNEIMTGEASVCIMSRYCYDYVKDKDGFSDVYDEAYPLSETDFGRYFTAMHIFPEDTVLCLRRISTMPSIEGRGETEREYANQVDFFERILNFIPPAGWEGNEE